MSRKKTAAQLDAEIAQALTARYLKAEHARFTVPTMGLRGQIAPPAPSARLCPPSPDASS